MMAKEEAGERGDKGTGVTGKSNLTKHQQRHENKNKTIQEDQ